MKKISPHKLYEMSLDANGVCNRDKYIELMIKEGWVIPKVYNPTKTEEFKKYQAIRLVQ